MNTLIYAAFVIFGISSTSVWAAPARTAATRGGSGGDTGKIGVGFAVGFPLALSVRYDLSPKYAADAQLAPGDNFVMMYGDFLMLFHGMFGRKNRFTELLTPYIGAGPFLALASREEHGRAHYFNNDDDDFALGVRVPVGAEWRWDKYPFGFGAEVAPGFVLTPSTHAFVHLGGTARFYF
jgi:hypothetical protein